MKSFLRTFLLAGIPAGVFGGLYFRLEQGISAVWSGIAAGFVGGLVAAVVARVQQNRVSDSRPVLTEEVILQQARANHQDLGVGWLYLTNRRLLFEGYPTNDTEPEVTQLFETYLGQATGHEVSIPIHQISEVVMSKPLGLVPRLDVVLTNGDTIHFGTENPQEWVDEISTARQKYLDEPRTEDMKLFSVN